MCTNMNELHLPIRIHGSRSQILHCGMRSIWDSISNWRMEFRLTIPYSALWGWYARRVCSSFSGNGRNCWTAMKGKSWKKSSVWMGKPCVPIKGKGQNHAISFLPGAGKTDTAWGRKQWKKKVMRSRQSPKYWKA